MAARFVNEAPAALTPGGVALLGVNTRHLPDARVVALVEQSPLRLVRRYFSDDQIPPYSQVYVLGHR